MSRSRKAPWFSDTSRSKTDYKRFANKAVRNMEFVPDGMAYKKCYCSYNIKDWKCQSDDPKATRK